MEEKNNKDKNYELIKIHHWDGEGYQPCVSYGDWLVALMNWEQGFKITDIGPIERHNETDEVFVLLEGKSVLFVIYNHQVEAIDMQHGIIYNVPKSTWHNVLGTENAKWLIVESANTDESNSEYRRMTNDEIKSLFDQLPDWCNK